MSESSPFQSANKNFGFDNDIEMNFTEQTLKRGELKVHTFITFHFQSVFVME